MFRKNAVKGLYAVPDSLRADYDAASITEEKLWRHEDDAAIELLKAQGNPSPSPSQRADLRQQKRSEVQRMAEHLIRLTYAHGIMRARARDAERAKFKESLLKTCAACGGRWPSPRVSVRRLPDRASARLCAECHSTALTMIAEAAATPARRESVGRLLKSSQSA